MLIARNEWGNLTTGWGKISVLNSSCQNNITRLLTIQILPAPFAETLKKVIFHILQGIQGILYVWQMLALSHLTLTPVAAIL